MRFLTWNILHGGGPARLPEIILSLLSHKPDVVALTEFRITRGSQVRAVLADHGLTHQLVSHREDGGGNGILIASRQPLTPTTHAGPNGSNGRWLEASMAGLHIVAVHVPDDTNLAAKAAHWQRLLSLARLRLVENCIFLGDFNTGRKHQDGPVSGRMGAAQTTGCEALLGSLLSLGFVDAWRRLHPNGREFSWVSPAGEGRRIDSAYLSPPLASVLQAASYSHFERESGLSDHAPLLIDLDVARALEGGKHSHSGTPRRGGLFGSQAD
jgi:exodeoxyribonuclease-3